MKQNNFFLILQVILLFQITLVNSTTLNKYETIHSAIPQPNIYTNSIATAGYGMGELSVFGDSLYGTSYVGTNRNTYAYFIENGAQKFTPVQMNEGLTGKGLYSDNCKVNDDLLIIYSQVHQETPRKRVISGNRLKLNGNKEGTEFSISTHIDHHMDRCMQISSNLAAILFTDDRKSGYSSWNAAIATFDLTTNSIVTFLQMADESNSIKINVDGTVLKGTNNGIFLTLFRQGGGTLGAGKDGLYIQQHNISDGSKVSGETNQHIIARDTILYDSYDIKADEKGGFTIVYAQSDGIRIATFNSNFVRLCDEQLVNQTITDFQQRPQFVLHEKIAYIIYADQTTTKLLLMEANAETCALIDANVKEIFTGATDLFSYKISISEKKSDITRLVLGIVLSDKINATTQETYYFQYFLLYTGLTCDVQYCSFCWPYRNVCETCQGTTDPNKGIRIRDDFTCTCQDGYFHKTGEIDCQACQSKCETCSTSEENCGICKYPDPNQLAAPDCICKPGWVDNGSNGCEQCDTTTCVNTCTIDKFDCDQCKDTYIKIGNSCLSCTSPCKNCSGTQDTCDSCVERYYLQVNTCLDCAGQCQTCTSNPTNCGTCRYSDPNMLSAPDCICKPGWVDDGANGCEECSTKCVSTCTGTKENCDQCKPTFVKSGNQCIPCVSPCINCQTDENTCTSCITGKYLSGNTCLDCDDQCLTCSDNSSKCGQCKYSDPNLLLAPDCTCKPGWVDNGSNGCEQCDSTTCVSTCTNNRLNCDQCIETYVKIGNQCLSCNFPCKTCSGDQNTCDTCEEGYYQQGNSCIQCPHPFLKCENAETPTECKSGIGRSGLEEKCKCKPEYFEQIVENNDCGQCTYPCTLCFESPTNCIDCSDRKCGTCLENSSLCDISCGDTCTRCNEDGSCKTCLIGQYLDDQTKTCKNCNPKCEICDSTDKNTCISCKLNGIGRTNEISTNCGCQDGYLEEENTLNCVKCTVTGCKKCDSSQNCLICMNVNLIPPLCQKEKKGTLVEVITNPDGSNNQVVKNCDFQCEKCEISQTQCNECIQGFNRENAPSCICKPGYHDNNGQQKDCQKCPLLCKTCENSSMCLECMENAKIELNMYSGICQCKEGFKFDEITSECRKCYQFLGECLLICPQNSIKDEEKSVCISRNLEVNDYLSLFYLCGGVCVLLYLLSILVQITFVKTQFSHAKKNNWLQKRKEENIQQEQ